MLQLHTRTRMYKPTAAMQNTAIATQWTSTRMPVHHSGISALRMQILLGQG